MFWPQSEASSTLDPPPQTTWNVLISHKMKWWTLRRPAQTRQFPALFPQSPTLYIGPGRPPNTNPYIQTLQKSFLLTTTTTTTAWSSTISNNLSPRCPAPTLIPLPANTGTDTPTVSFQGHRRRALRPPTSNFPPLTRTWVFRRPAPSHHRARQLSKPLCRHDYPLHATRPTSEPSRLVYDHPTPTHPYPPTHPGTGTQTVWPLWRC